jgi:hypothetical protein
VKCIDLIESDSPKFGPQRCPNCESDSYETDSETYEAHDEWIGESAPHRDFWCAECGFVWSDAAIPAA